MSRSFKFQAGSRVEVQLSFLKDVRAVLGLSGIEKDLGPTIRTVRFEEFRIPSILRGGATIPIQP